MKTPEQTSLARKDAEMRELRAELVRSKHNFALCLEVLEATAKEVPLGRKDRVRMQAEVLDVFRRLLCPPPTARNNTPRTVYSLEVSLIIRATLSK